LLVVSIFFDRPHCDHYLYDASIQFFRGSIDRQAAISIRCFADKSIWRSYVTAKDVFCHVRRTLSHIPGVFLTSLHSAGLISALGSTSSCESGLCHLSASIYLVSLDTLLRAIGKRAHPLHILAYLSSECVVISAMWYVPQPPVPRFHPIGSS
jgi:hypothetical protein